MLGVDVVNRWVKAVFPARNGALSARWVHPDGRTVLIHSAYDPVSSATKIADQIALSDQPTVRLFGVGLGYVAEAILSRLPADCTLCLFDPDPQIVDWLAEHRPDSILLSDARVEWRGVLPASTEVDFESPELAQLCADDVVESCVSRDPSRRQWRSDSEPVILFLKSGYLVEWEILHAWRSIGVRVVELSYTIGRNFIERLVEAIYTTQPAFIFTLNHLGFDREGELKTLLERLGIPVASWFVDSPNYILLNHYSNSSELTTPFVWDEAYASRLSEWFAPAVWLPLAGDLRRLREPLCTSPTNEIVFVGDSQIEAATKWRRKLPSDEWYDRLIQGGVEWVRGERRPVWEWNTLCGVEDELTRLHAESAVILEASRQLRHELVQTIGSTLPLRVYGDDGWKLVTGEFIHSTCADYLREVPEIYRTGAVTLNVTSYQMPTGVNQRVFDVPVCGGVLLTDRQCDLERLFPGFALYCFDTMDDAKELSKWLRQHREAALQQRLRHVELIAEQHTYQHRVRIVLDTMRSRYQKSRVLSQPASYTL